MIQQASNTNKLFTFFQSERVNFNLGQGATINGTPFDLINNGILEGYAIVAPNGEISLGILTSHRPSRNILSYLSDLEDYARSIGSTPFCTIRATNSNRMRMVSMLLRRNYLVQGSLLQTDAAMRQHASTLFDNGLDVTLR